MSLFSSISSAYKSATKSLQNFGASLASNLTKSKQPAAVGSANLSPSPIKMGPTIITVPQGFSVSKTGQLVKDTATPQIQGLQGGNIQNAINTGQLNLSPSLPSTPTRTTSSSFGAPTIPSSITSDTIKSGSSISLAGASGGSSGSPIGISGGASSTGAGALASIQAGMTSPNAYSTETQYDSETGKPVKDKSQFDTQSLIDMMSQIDETAPSVNREKIYAEEQQTAQLEQRKQEVNNYTAQLNSIQAQAQADQLSLIGQGRGIPEVIIGGQQEQIAREAAIRALPVAAQLSAAQGNLQLAQDHLDTMYKLRVQDAEDKYSRWEQTRNAVLPILTAAEKRRLDVIDQGKADERDAAKTEAAREWEMYKMRINPEILGSAETGYFSYNPITGEKTQISGGGSGGSTKPMSVLDVARYNELYPDAGVTAGDTEAQANAKVAASNSPEGKLRSMVVAAQTNGNDYKTVVAEINSDATIKDKTTALAIAKEVYGTTATSPIEQEIERMKAGGILTNADIRSALRNRYTPDEVNNSSVGSILDKIGSFLFSK